MHELGVLKHAIKTVDNVATKNNIKAIKFITLEVGTESTFVPRFFEKLFPIAIEGYPLFEHATLKIEMVEGSGLVIKDIGY